MDLPNDILHEIDRRFATEKERQHVAEKLRSLYLMPLNVGPEQLARCLLILAGNSIVKLEALFENAFGGDPRDLIMAAMDASENGAHWGIAPFQM